MWHYATQLQHYDKSLLWGGATKDYMVVKQTSGVNYYNNDNIKQKDFLISLCQILPAIFDVQHFAPARELQQCMTQHHCLGHYKAEIHCCCMPINTT